MNLSFKTFLTVFCLSSGSAVSNAMEMKSPQEEATEGRYDYQAVLVTSDGSFGNCTGTLIAPGYVLTNAFCATKDFTKVQIGRHDLSDNNEDYEEINIATMIVDDKNSDYDYYSNTVAIMKLEEESSIEPVTLDTGSTDLSVDTEVTVLGWGLGSVGLYEDDFLAIDDEEVDGLLETETKIVSTENCEEMFNIPEDIDLDKLLCTYRTDAEDLYDVCHGDLGSAVIVKGSSSSSDVQVGVDVLVGCSTIGGLMPGFLFRVSYYKDFIDCVLDGGTEDCGKTIDVTEAPSRAPSRAPSKAPSRAPSKGPTEPTEAPEDDCCTDSDSSKTLLKLVRGFGF